MQNETEFQPAPPPSPNPNNDWVRGIGLLLLLHLIQIPMGTASYGMSLILIGLSQLIYVIPAIVIYRKKQRPGIVKGLIIGAAITLLINGTCTAMFIIYPPNFH